MSTPTPLTAHQPKPPPFGTAHRSPDVSQIPWRLLPQRRDSLPLNLSPSPKSSPPISTHERSSSLNTSWPSPRPRGQVRFDDEDDVAPAIPARPLSGPSRASNGSGFPAGLHEFLLAPMPEPHPRRRTDMLPFGPLDAHYGTLRPTMPINWKTQASSSLNESRRRRRASDALYAKHASENLRSILDLCTRTLSSRLDLSLVYILALRLPTPASPLPPNACEILAITQSSPYPPAYPLELHLRALRIEQGGLLYRQAPGNVESPYEAVIILPVSEADGVGVLLAGFSVKKGRVLDAEDLDVFLGVARMARACVLNASGESLV